MLRCALCEVVDRGGCAVARSGVMRHGSAVMVFRKTYAPPLVKANEGGWELGLKRSVVSVMTRLVRVVLWLFLFDSLVSEVKVGGCVCDPWLQCVCLVARSGRG